MQKKHVGTVLGLGLAAGLLAPAEPVCADGCHTRTECEYNTLWEYRCCSESTTCWDPDRGVYPCTETICIGSEVGSCNGGWC